MDNGDTIRKLRKEFSDYLKETHSEWKDSTIKTYVADAFFIWGRTLVASFWSVLVDDESMKNGEAVIEDYLENVIGDENAKARTAAYYKELCRLKEFVDSRYGGIKNYVGAEFECENVIYKYAKQVCEGGLSKDEAVELMCTEVPWLNATSHGFSIILLEAMLKGKKYSRRLNLNLLVCYLKSIYRDYGYEKLSNALKASYENIQYYYEQTGGKSVSFCRECQKIADEYQVDITFDDSMFDGIVPVNQNNDDILVKKQTRKYWIYSPNDNWNKYQEESIFSIGRDYLGDPYLYETKADMQAAMQDCDAGRYVTSCKNACLEVWQFMYDIQVGDVVYAKSGTKTIIGRGIVTSTFIYDETKPTGYQYYRKIDWEYVGEWEHPGKAVTKTLTDITAYTNYVKELEKLFFGDESELQDVITDNEMYTTDDFLQDVYMDENQYKDLKNLLMIKKNIILQGAPGVGKTYAAKRLAFSIMGEKDESRVKMIQFHQSYSYEDFIMGYRPTSTGFELKKGVFYEFCKAAADDSRPYFFIIDEINRGNLSKIFGELFMLIESDKRGVELQLLYEDEQFSIPGNVYIIGMMNTADRSLAMLDYALRRRFAFFDMKPGFDTDGFITYQKSINNRRYDILINTIKELNKAIMADESLGEGFCIGHSYFCTQMTITDEWIKSVIEYEIIPLIKEYWFDDSTSLSKWIEKLREVMK